MSEDKVRKIVDDAASNVACESGEVSKTTLEMIKERLLYFANKGSKNDDDSFIFRLVMGVKKEFVSIEEKKGVNKSRGKRK